MIQPKTEENISKKERDNFLIAYIKTYIISQGRKYNLNGQESTFCPFSYINKINNTEGF